MSMKWRCIRGKTMSSHCHRTRFYMQQTSNLPNEPIKCIIPLASCPEVLCWFIWFLLLWLPNGCIREEFIYEFWKNHKQIVTHFSFPTWCLVENSLTLERIFFDPNFIFLYGDYGFWKWTSFSFEMMVLGSSFWKHLPSRSIFGP